LNRNSLTGYLTISNPLIHTAPLPQAVSTIQEREGLLRVINTEGKASSRQIQEALVRAQKQISSSRTSLQPLIFIESMKSFLHTISAIQVISSSPVAFTHLILRSWLWRMIDPSFSTSLHTLLKSSILFTNSRILQQDSQSLWQFAKNYQNLLQFTIYLILKLYILHFLQKSLY